MPRSYYNEIDKYCYKWLLNLIDAGLIPYGDVDDRPIQEVQPDDLYGYVQCHFFAGIAGWAWALRLARWPDDVPIWTGSCPCQPFSVAGKRKGSEDPRHLWPYFYQLIRACRPSVVMGEQVGGPLGRDWLDGVVSDLETSAFEVGAVDIPACAVDAPERRNRLYWVAKSEIESKREQKHEIGTESWKRARADISWSGTRLGFWNDFILIGPDRKDKFRRIEPGTFPVDTRVPETMARLCAFGNAINPELAAEVIRAYMDVYELPLAII